MEWPPGDGATARGPHAPRDGSDVHRLVRYPPAETRRRGRRPALHETKARLRGGRGTDAEPRSRAPRSASREFLDRKPFLQARGDPVAALFVSHHALVRHPVELNRAPLPHVRRVTVPGVVGAAKEDSGPGLRRNIREVVVEARGRSKETKPAAFAPPSRVQVQEHGHDFRFGVGVDAAVLGSRLTPHGDHRRSSREVDSELLFDGGAKLGPAKLLHKSREAGAERELAHGEASALVDGRKSGEHQLERRSLKETGNHEMVERFPYERRLPEPFVVDHFAASLFLTAPRTSSTSIAVRQTLPYPGHRC